MSDAQNTTAWAVVAFAELHPNHLTLVVYAAAVPTEAEAIDLVKAQPGVRPAVEIQEVARLSSETTQSLALRPGEVRML